QNRFAPDGTLQSMVVRGHVPEGDAAENYEVKNGTYTWTSPVDHGSGQVRSGLEYVAFGGTIDSFGFILDHMRKSPDHSVDLLTSGKGGLKNLPSFEVSNGKEKKPLTAYAVTGFGLSPFPIWMDGDKFFGVANVLSFLPEGWEKVAPELSKTQD